MLNNFSFLCHFSAKCKPGETNQQYVTRCNVELAKVAARGISVLVATQDEGAAGPTNYDCHDQQHPGPSIFHNTYFSFLSLYNVEPFGCFSLCSRLFSAVHLNYFVQSLNDLYFPL